MSYLLFASVALNKWDVTVPAKSAKPIATITRRRGKCSVKTTTDHAINLEELLSVSDFMQEHERAT